MPLSIVLSFPVPSSSVNLRSFFDLGTASQAFTFTALKSDLLKVSKSTKSVNSGSITTLEKSMVLFEVKNPLLSPLDREVLDESSEPVFSDLRVGNKSTSRIA